jgi:hypothetical protein
MKQLEIMCVGCGFILAGRLGHENEQSPFLSKEYQVEKYQPERKY